MMGLLTRAGARNVGGGGLSWVLAALWAVLVCGAATMIVAGVDEFRLPPSNVRRMGALIALIAVFASLWLLVTPLTVAPGIACDPPLLVLAEFADPPAMVAPDCRDSLRPVALAGLAAALAAPIIVLATRRHRD